MEAGEPDVFNFIAKTATRNVEELIQRMWDYRKASDHARKSTLTRIERLELTEEMGCETPDCKW